MHFEAQISVVIANKLVTTIHSVLTKFDSTHIGGSCDIVVPLNCRLQYLDGKHDSLTAYTLNIFKVGDPVVITASYLGYPTVTIFQGNVYEFKEGMPCTIRCINYLSLLGRVQDFHGTITIKNLITNLLKGTGITLMLPSIDLTLSNITFRSMSPWAILEYLKKNIGLNISLFQQNLLYCNVASNTLDVVKYSTDRNVISCSLQTPDTVWQGYKVKAYFVKENGTKDSVTVGDTDGHLVEVYFYKIAGGVPVYLKLATEALNRCRQRKYSGEVETYLYPFPQMYDKIDFTNIRYPDQSGNYVVTGLSHSLNDEGFHLKMKWAFLTDFINQV